MATSPTKPKPSKPAKAPHGGYHKVQPWMKMADRKHLFLTNYLKNGCNAAKTLKNTGLGEDRAKVWRREDSEFRAAMDELKAQRNMDLLDEVHDAASDVALGRHPSSDGKPNVALLGKFLDRLDPVAKKLDVNYSGSIAIESAVNAIPLAGVDEEMKRISGNAEDDGVLELRPNEEGEYE